MEKRVLKNNKKTTPNQTNTNKQEKKKREKKKKRLANEKDLNAEATERNHKGKMQNALYPPHYSPT